MRWSRAGLVVAMLGLSACDPIDSEDCRTFARPQCALYRPQGLACGLANQHGYLQTRGQHVGGSCQFDWDPALELSTAALEPVSARAKEEPCPPGHRPVPLPDKSNDDWDDGIMVTCLAEGNADRSSAELRDVPAGAVCGLGRTLERRLETCEGASRPELGECPPGWTFRWVPDRVADSVGDDCLTFENDGIVEIDESFGAIPLTFCQLDASAGFTSRQLDAGDPRIRRAVAGTLCGLHWRTVGQTLTRPGDWDFDWVARFARTCIDEATEGPPPHLALIGDVLEQGYYEPPQCLGRSVWDHPEKPCPDRLALTCAVNFISELYTPESWLCWCDLVENQQATDAEAAERVQ